MRKCGYSLSTSQSPWSSSSDGDLEGAGKSVCLHSGQDELYKCHFPPLGTSHRSQSMHAEHLGDYLATWQILLQGDLELIRCNFYFSRSQCTGKFLEALELLPPKKNSRCPQAYQVFHGNHFVASLYTTSLFCSVLSLKKTSSSLPIRHSDAMPQKVDPP